MDLAAIHSTSSTSLSFLEHDVFISFRGEDTRKNFTDHLHKAFCDKRIKVYIDEKSLEKGEEISSALSQAIQKSKISLIIFSENYASSTWCLDELLHILKCKEDNGQIVVPIFYGVDPSHVRKQLGSFAHAFVAHQERFKDSTEKLHEWKTALERACSISGWDSRDRYETKLIEEIVEYVVSKLSYTSSHITADDVFEFEGPVGIKRQLWKFESLFCAYSQDVRILGIWGMRGIGKTTLARVVFKTFASQFDGCCFLENIREQYSRHGLAYLESKLFANLLQDKDINMVSHFVKHRIGRKKVLIVLDDVDDLEQLERLAGDRTWFGSGSRIIITTRDRQLLRLFAVNEIYEVERLNFDEALQLFCSRAFRRGTVIPDYAELSQSVVHYADGIPLGVIVLGSFLYCRCKEECESALDKLKKIPEMKILKKLIVSYDQLDEMENYNFLDIARFLKGRDKDFVQRMEEEFGSAATISICCLIYKSLTSIKGDGEIYMHKLLLKMAWEIDRDSNKSCKRHYCSSIDKEIGAEGGYFDVSNLDYQDLCKVFGKRYQDCYDYPRKSLSSKINAHNLVEVDMPCKKLKQYWNEVQGTSSGTTIGIFISYEGQWRRSIWGHWNFNGLKAKGITVSEDITYHELVERLYNSLMVDQSQYDLDMRFLVDSVVILPPVEIRNDDDVKFFIGETSRKGIRRYPLCITLVRKDIGQHVVVESNNGSGGISLLFQLGHKLNIFRK